MAIIKKARALGILAVFVAVAGVIFAFAPEEKQPPARQMRTIKYFIYQDPAVLVNGNSTTTQFSIFTGEQDPVIKDAYVEISGVTKDVVTLSADIRNTGGATCSESFATPREKSYTIDSSAQQNHFEIFYAGTGTTTIASLRYCLEQIITSPGSYSFEFKNSIFGGDASALQARIVITYQFTPPSEGGALPIKGELTSAVFDSGVVAGAAYNSVMWKGVVEGTGKVRFQIATSDCENGATNAPTCSVGTWQFLGGATCGVGDWYDTLTSGSGGGPGKPVEISCAAANHNNHRYYRYKIQICSNVDCTSVGATSPEVSDVVVSWSP